MSDSRTRRRLFFNLVIFFYHYNFNHRCKWKFLLPLLLFCLTEFHNEKRLFLPDRARVSFKLYTPGKEWMHLFRCKNHLNKYPSLWAAAHLRMQQFKILLSNKARHQMKVHSGFKHLQTMFSCLHTASPAFLSWRYWNRKQWNRALAHPIAPGVFQVNNPKSCENSIFSFPLQGANSLKSKHSKQAETQPLNPTKL